MQEAHAHLLGREPCEPGAQCGRIPYVDGPQDQLAAVRERDVLAPRRGAARDSPGPVAIGSWRRVRVALLIMLPL